MLCISKIVVFSDVVQSGCHGSIINTTWRDCQFFVKLFVALILSEPAVVFLDHVVSLIDGFQSAYPKIRIETLPESLNESIDLMVLDYFVCISSNPSPTQVLSLRIRNHSPLVCLVS